MTINHRDKSIEVEPGELEDMVFDDSVVLVYYNIVTGEPLFAAERVDGKYEQLLTMQVNIPGFKSSVDFGLNDEGQDFTQVLHVSEAIIK